MISRPPRRPESPAPSEWSAVSRYNSGNFNAETNSSRSQHTRNPSGKSSQNSHKSSEEEHQTPAVHYGSLQAFLIPMLQRGELTVRSTKAREKLTRLSRLQFQELSTDVYDELNRRKEPPTNYNQFLNPKETYHPKRNQARQKLSTLPHGRFKDLCSDVFWELERRFPTLGSTPMPRTREDGYPRRPSNMGQGRYYQETRSISEPQQRVAMQNIVVPNKSVAVLEEVVSPTSMIDTYNSRTSDPHDNRGSVDSSHNQLRKLEDMVAQMEEKLRMHKVQKEAEISEINSKMDQERQLREKAESELADKNRSRNSFDDSKQSSESSHGSMDQLMRENEDMRRELDDQRRVTEEVRKEAEEFLNEMRDLAERETETADRLENLFNENEQLKKECSDWKQRYVTTKSRLRNLRATSVSSPGFATRERFERESAMIHADGVISVQHLVAFQLAIDELLQVARNQNCRAVLDHVRDVVSGTKAIHNDLRAADGKQDEQEMEELESELSSCTNGIITACRNHAFSDSLSPVGLVDAAASQLTISVINLVKRLKLKESNEDECDVEGLSISRSFDQALLDSETASRRSSIPNSPASRTNRSISMTKSSPELRKSSRPVSSAPTGNSVGESQKQGTTLLYLRNELEGFTEMVAESIQQLLNAVRQDAGKSAISKHIEKITSSVDASVSLTNGILESNEYDLSSAGPVLQRMHTCCQRMAQICSGNNEEEIREKGTKQLLAGVAFDCAKQIKGLLHVIESMNEPEDESLL